MAEINLLKNPSINHNTWQTISGLAVKLLAVLAVGVIGYYGFLFFKVKSATADLFATEQNITKAKQEALSLQGRQEFLVRQAQLKEFINLSSGHVYFSKLFSELAKVTLKSAYYNNITLNTQGKLNLQVAVPSLEELDKFLKVFDQPDINKNFYNVRLSGFTKSEDETGSIYTFSVQIDYNPAIFSKSQ